MNDRRSCIRQLLAKPLYKPCHDFAMLNGLANAPATKTAVQLASQKLSEAFRKHA